MHPLFAIAAAHNPNAWVPQGASRGALGQLAARPRIGGPRLTSHQIAQRSAREEMAAYAALPPELWDGCPPAEIPCGSWEPGDDPICCPGLPFGAGIIVGTFGDVDPRLANPACEYDIDCAPDVCDLATLTCKPTSLAPVTPAAPAPAARLRRPMRAAMARSVAARRFPPGAVGRGTTQLVWTPSGPVPASSCPAGQVVCGSVPAGEDPYCCPSSGGGGGGGGPPSTFERVLPHPYPDKSNRLIRTARLVPENQAG